MLQAELGTAADFLESYELVAFDVADPEGAANDIVAGAVHGGAAVIGERQVGTGQSRIPSHAG